MSQKNVFLRTDLAAEWREEHSHLPKGVFFEEREQNGWTVSTLHIQSPEGAAAMGRAQGIYQTVALGKSWLFGEEERLLATKTLSSLIRQALLRLEQSDRDGDPSQKPQSDGPILVVGLGNRAMTADAIGPMTVERILVTNHVKQLDPPLFSRLNHRAVAAICPGVLGQTGIESALTVQAVVKSLRPRALLVIDALAARSVERLATTVQLSTGGIAPGSGVGNDRPAFTSRRLGVPVLALGVPTVVDSATLVFDAFQKAGIDDLPPALLPVLENGKSFFVSLKEADAAFKALADLLAHAIDEALAL
ncbi:MAG: GPR endopeptidase [Clostridia bacterium]|nr:GPR endopeptidase [Clostridia bacterium]